MAGWVARYLRGGQMSRHPYTNAVDMIRCCPGIELGPSGVKLSRAEASKLLREIAKATKMTEEELAIKLSEYYQANQEKWTDDIIEKYIPGGSFYPKCP